jgi:hypothetical protein
VQLVTIALKVVVNRQEENLNQKKAPLVYQPAIRQDLPGRSHIRDHIQVDR